MSADDARISYRTDDITDWLQRVLQRFGMFAADSAPLIERWLESEFRGRAGIASIVELANAFEMGDIDPRARTLTVVDLPAFAVMEGSTGVGEVGATRAMRLAIDKAATAGIAVVVIRNSQPCGDVRTIAELASLSGCLGFCTTNSGKAIHPPAQPLLSNHPQAWSLPGDEGTCWTAGRDLKAEDFASTESAAQGFWHGAISLALTAGVTASRLPGVKKKVSPYGSGAEHCCLAVNLQAIQADEHWRSWTTEGLGQMTGVWDRVTAGVPPESCAITSELQQQLAEVAKTSRIPLPEPIA